MVRGTKGITIRGASHGERSEIAAGVVLAALVLGGCRSVDAQLTIPAPPEKVWSVLMDGDRYGEWNPVLVEVDGEFREGATLTYQMMTESGEAAEVDGTRRSSSTRVANSNQAGGIWGVMTFDHHWILEPVEGGTRVTQHEDYDRHRRPVLGPELVPRGLRPRKPGASGSRVGGRRPGGCEVSKPTVGFIGLGAMGEPMARAPARQAAFASSSCANRSRERDRAAGSEIGVGGTRRCAAAVGADADILMTDRLRRTAVGCRCSAGIGRCTF